MRIEDAFYKLNSDNKIELHFDGREAYQKLPDNVKQDIKRAFIWGRRRGAWVSRAKGVGIPYQMKSYEIPFEGADELNTFDAMQERKAQRLENRANRFEERASKRDSKARSLQADFNKMRGDWSWLTQPNINSSAGRSFTNSRNRIMDRYDKGMRMSISADKLRDAAEDMRGRASQAELNSEKYLLNRIKEGEKALRRFDKFQSNYADKLQKIDEQPQDWQVWLMSRMRDYELEFQKLAYFQHHFDVLQSKKAEAGKMTFDQVQNRLKGFSKELKDHFKSRYGITLKNVRKQFGTGERTFYFGRADKDLPEKFRSRHSASNILEGRFHELVKLIDADKPYFDPNNPKHQEKKAELQDEIDKTMAAIDEWTEEGEKQRKEDAESIEQMRPQLTAIVNEDRISGKAPSTKDYANWFASINRLMQMALKVDDNEASKILQKHEKAVSEAWAKNMSSLDAGLFIAGEMDKAREAEQAETAKETRTILQQEADTRDKYAESKGGFDFIHEVGYSGKSVIKTYLPLPESRGLKLNGEPDADGYRMYWATDKALEKLKQDYPNNQYGMGQEYGVKHLNKSPKLKKMGMSLAEMKALNKGMKAVPGSKKHQEAKKELSKARNDKPGKHYLTSIEIEWAEADPDLNLDGKKYDSAAAFMADLIKVGVPDSGYNKVKFKAKWDNGAEIVDRIDVGASGGDYNPLKEGITAYMDRQKSVMYQSSRDATDVASGKYTFRFSDDAPPKPTSKPKRKHNFDIKSDYVPYAKDSNYDAIRARIITPKVYGNRYRIDFIEWRSGNSRVEVTKIDNNPFGGLMGKDFETFADAERAYKSEVIKDGINALKTYVDTNLVAMRKQFDQDKSDKLKILKLRAKAIKLKFKFK